MLFLQTRLISLALTISLFLSLPIAAQSSVDAAALRSLAENYFAAFAREDADSLARLWSANSPDFEAAMKSLRGVFGALDRIEAKDLRLVKADAEGDRARLLISIELGAIVAQTGDRYPGWGKGHRRLELVREGGVWKVWRESSAEDDLASLYLKAGTEEERAQVLAREPELVTEDLVRRIWRQGQALYGQNKYAESLRVLRLALALAERIKYTQGEADALKVIALAERLLGNYEESFKSSNRSLSLYRQVNDRENEAKVLNNLGLTYQSQGDYRQGLDYYQKSLAIFEELKIKWAIGATLTSLGLVYSAQGDNARALDYYERGLALAREVKDRKSEANALSYIGTLYGNQGNYPLALNHLSRAHELLQSLKDKDGVAMTLNNIGVIYRTQGDGARALEHYQQSLQIYQELGSKSYIAATTTNVGNVYQELGDYAQALAHYEKALQMFEAMGEKTHMAVVLSSMASAYELQGDHQKALELAERASTLARQVGRMFTYQEARTTAGSAALALNQTALARKAFEEAISTIETLREQVAGSEQERGRFFENRVSPYQEMVRLLVSENKPAEALNFAERAKGRVLLEVLRNGRADVSKAMTALEREREQQLRAALYALNSEVARESRRAQPDKARLDLLMARLAQARLELESFKNNLYAAHPELKVQRGESPAIRHEEATALIPDAGTALLEYVVNPDRTYLFVLTKGKEGGQKINLQSYTIAVGEKELARRAESLRQQIAARNFAFRKDAKELFDLLLGPAAKQLESAKSLIIVPDRALWNLPFQATLTERGQYLIENYAISYAPSLSVLAEMTKTRRKRHGSLPNDSSTLLALGNPVVGEKILQRAKSGLMDESLEPLPEAERQVTELSRIYGALRSKVYTGASATEDRVKAEAGGYRVLQLAAHGILNDSNPMYSHIVLSQAKEHNEDGLLEAWEMMNLNLNADMVVLSACETARGRINAGEGVIGMSWALFIAGSPATVVSQWKVDSAGTTELMIEFHRQIKSATRRAPAPVTKAEALRQAALKLMKTAAYKHPFYWAGFVVIGDPW